MALFGTKQKKTKKASEPMSGGKKIENPMLENVLTAPWLSEKALIGTEKGVYVFQVPAEVTKTEVKLAVERVFKVVPVKVNIANLPGKRKSLRTRRGFGTRAARHKAYVYLKKGETITFA